MSTTKTIDEHCAAVVKKYKQYLEHAPAVGYGAPDNLLGWIDANGLSVCTNCTGRIVARGLNLDLPALALWSDRGDTAHRCSLCSEKEPKQ